MNAHERRKAARAYVRAYSEGRDGKRLRARTHRRFVESLLRQESWYRTWWARASRAIVGMGLRE